MFEGDAEILGDFVTESREGLSEIESNLLAIEAAGADLDLDVVNKVFRSIHSIKGAASFLGLSRIGELSHNMEHVLSEVRNRTLIPTSPIVDQLLRSADQLKLLIESVETSNTVDVSQNVRELKRIDQRYAGPNDQSLAPQLNVEPTVIQPPAQDFGVDTGLIQQQMDAGQNVFEVVFDLLSDREAFQLSDLVLRLQDVGTLLESYLDFSGYTGTAGEPLEWHVLYATALNADQFATFFSLPSQRVRPQRGAVGESCIDAVPEKSAAVPVVETSETAQKYGASKGPGPTESDGNPLDEVAGHVEHSLQDTVCRAELAAVRESAGTKKMPASDANIRVSVSVLDRLMNLAGELVLSRNQLLIAAAGGDGRALESTCTRIDQVTCELQDAIMRTRMQPVGTVFSKFTRVVRDLAQQLGKQCELEIHGKDVELDRTIIEAISDPLTHLVRNSMDHGLESPEIRKQNGKNPVGTVKLTARHQDGKVLLCISDDGAGINAERIRRKAIEKGLISAESALTMSDRDAVQLIFTPGFSTAEQVTSVSGRGVGMDVVKTNIERIGGSIEIETAVGTGTTMLVHLPLTLAIIPSLIASCRGQRFAIPQLSILELVRVKAEELGDRLGHVNQSEVLRLRGSLLPLVRLDQIFGDSQGADALTPQLTHIVVVESGRTRFGVVVDQLHDSEEIVVKPLGKHLKHLAFLSGATILGDGRIAMILDAGGLANRAQLQSKQQGLQSCPAAVETVGSSEQFSVLLFSNHPDEWFGVPMSIILRIERIRADQIDSVASRKVLQYRGGTLSLLSLDECIDARPRALSDHLFVIVFRRADREIGLLAPDVSDIRQITSDLDTVSFQETGVLGSCVIDGRPVRILDAFELGTSDCGTARSLIRGEPDAAPKADTDAGRSATVLYAEDSTFFRNKIAKLLQQEGWQVIACEDGQAAWEKLCDGAEPQIVLTDVEMPRMNGFELCQKIRSSGRWPDLPVIAITSLAADADRAHGIQCGVTEYLVKLDRDLLLSTLSRHLGMPCERE